jgi:hypothetical protein
VKRIHYHLRAVHEPKAIFLFVIEFQTENETLTVERVAIHPISDDGIIQSNICEEGQVITEEIYNDVIGMFTADGVLKAV